MAAISDVSSEFLLDHISVALSGREVPTSVHPVENSGAFVSHSPDDEVFTKRDTLAGRKTWVSRQIAQKIDHLNQVEGGGNVALAH